MGESLLCCGDGQTGQARVQRHARAAVHVQGPGGDTSPADGG